MADFVLLTTEDVLNKTFTTVKFREGYEIPEVDEFLDDVVQTIYQLQLERDEYKEKLEAAERRIEELSSGAAPVSDTAAPVSPAAAPSVPSSPSVAPAQHSEPVAQENPESAASMLALAQRVHDEYVSNGREKANQIVSEAEHKKDELLSEAVKKREDILSKLEQERVLMEKKIDELRVFENDYRQTLRNTLNHLLESVEESGNE